MKVIPVIDVLNGIVVHAVRGKRSEYQPLKSVITSSVEPLEVVKSFKSLGFDELYIADLDAIIDCSAGFTVLKDIVEETGVELMVDAGVTSVERAAGLIENGVSKVVVGTETLRSTRFVLDAVKQFGAERVIISLDLKGDLVLAPPDFDGTRDSFGLLDELVEMGVSQVIVLDLLRVGSGEGVNVDFLKQVKQKTSLGVYVGGGVRSVGDLVELKDLGIAGVLVASALHSGKITVQDLKHAGLF